MDLFIFLLWYHMMMKRKRAKIIMRRQITISGSIGWSGSWCKSTVLASQVSLCQLPLGPNVSTRSDVLCATFFETIIIIINLLNGEITDISRVQLIYNLLSHPSKKIIRIKYIIICKRITCLFRTKHAYFLLALPCVS